MTIRIGTINEMTGNGIEILVDEETRSEVLGRFFDGNLVSGGPAHSDPESATVITHS